MIPVEKFKLDTLSALKNKQLRSNFRLAMDGLIEKRREVFIDFDEFQNLRDLGHSIKKNALSKLPDLLEKLEYNCKRNGIQVHWAESTFDANQIVLEIANRSEVKSVVKGKSMVSEEME